MEHFNSALRKVVSKDALILSVILFILNKIMDVFYLH